MLIFTDGFKHENITGCAKISQKKISSKVSIDVVMCWILTHIGTI